METSGWSFRLTGAARLSCFAAVFDTGRCVDNWRLSVKVGDLVQERSRIVRERAPWTGIVIADYYGNAGRLGLASREVQVHFLTHNVSRWMLADQLEVVSESR